MRGKLIINKSTHTQIFILKWKSETNTIKIDEGSRNLLPSNSFPTQPVRKSRVLQRILHFSPSEMRKINTSSCGSCQGKKNAGDRSKHATTTLEKRKLLHVTESSEKNFSLSVRERKSFFPTRDFTLLYAKIFLPPVQLMFSLCSRKVTLCRIRFSFWNCVWKISICVCEAKLILIYSYQIARKFLGILTLTF